MENKICAGQRVLYKQGSNNSWLVGIVNHGTAEINEQGIWIPIIPISFAHLDPEDIPEIHYAEITNIFSGGGKLQEWVKKYPECYMTKEDYIEFTKTEDFNKAVEVAYFADDEYYYYPVSRFNASWIMKQPFDYIVRND